MKSQVIEKVKDISNLGCEVSYKYDNYYTFLIRIKNM